MPDSLQNLVNDIGLKNLELARGVEKLATINGIPQDYDDVLQAAQVLSGELRAIGESFLTEAEEQGKREVTSALQQVSKVVTEVAAIRKLYPLGTTTFNLEGPESTPDGMQTRLQQWAIHGRQIRTAQLRLSDCVDELQSLLVKPDNSSFDCRTQFLTNQVRDILERIFVDYHQRSKNVLNQARLLRTHAEFEPEVWAGYTKYIAMLTGRKNDGSVSPDTFFYSNVREYVLARLEELHEDCKCTPYLLKAIEVSSYCLSPEVKARHDASYDVWADQFFDPDRKDFVRNLNDRLQSLGSHQERYLSGEPSISSRAVYVHLYYFVQRLECLFNHLQNAERIVGALFEQAFQGRTFPRESAVTTCTWTDLSSPEKEAALDWLVATAAKSSGDKDSSSIADKGYFPKTFLDRETFRRVLTLDGSRLSLLTEDGKTVACSIALHGDVPEGSRSMKARYSDDVRVGVAWWMNIDPEARGKGLYDALNDEMLLDAIGKVDILVGRLKVGTCPSTHAFKAHLRRLHIPLGGFEDLPHGLHMHLVSFVSPSLRNMYFNYLRIDQDFAAVENVVHSQTEMAKLLEANKVAAQTELASFAKTIPGITEGPAIARLLLDQVTEPWAKTFDAVRFFESVLLFQENIKVPHPHQQN